MQKAEPESNIHTTVDEYGWPKELRWKNCDEPLFTVSPGDFISVEFKKPQGRWAYHRLLNERNPQALDEYLRRIQAEPAGKTAVERNEHSIVYTQRMKHPRLKWLFRRLEVYERQQRVTLTVQLDRISSELPEWFYVGCEFPTGSVLPTTSSGGVSFTPFSDQLPNTCRDYFAIDDWISYRTEKTCRTWITKDAPLVSIGGPLTLQHVDGEPENPNRLYAMVFDNTWMTNFVCDEHGIFEFGFEMIQHDPCSITDIQKMSETFLSTLPIVIHPGFPEDSTLMRRLHQP